MLRTVGRQADLQSVISCRACCQRRHEDRCVDKYCRCCELCLQAPRRAHKAASDWRMVFWYPGTTQGRRRKTSIHRRCRVSAKKYHASSSPVHVHSQRSSLDARCTVTSVGLNDRRAGLVPLYQSSMLCALPLLHVCNQTQQRFHGVISSLPISSLK
jgi:hypothetical protein